MTDDDEKHKRQFEQTKLEFEVVKHLSTLVTWSILFIATFVARLQVVQAKPRALYWSVRLLVVSLVFCVLWLASPWAEVKTRFLHKWVFGTAGVLFIWAICLLAYFVEGNLNALISK